jgi:hypothetical protein
MRKHSHSVSRGKRKLNKSIVRNLKEKLLKHPEICGQLKPSVFHVSDRNQSLDDFLQLASIKVEKIVLWTEGTLNKVIE